MTNRKPVPNPAGIYRRLRCAWSTNYQYLVTNYNQLHTLWQSGGQQLRPHLPNLRFALGRTKMRPRFKKNGITRGDNVNDAYPMVRLLPYTPIIIARSGVTHTQHNRIHRGNNSRGTAFFDLITRAISHPTWRRTKATICIREMVRESDPYHLLTPRGDPNRDECELPKTY